MTMGEIDILLNRLDKLEANLRAERQHDMDRIYDRLESIQKNGCNKAIFHEDHEIRIRAAEKYINRQAGQVAMIGGSVSLGTAILAWVGKFLLTKIG